MSLELCTDRCSRLCMFCLFSAVWYLFWLIDYFRPTGPLRVETLLSQPRGQCANQMLQTGLLRHGEGVAKMLSPALGPWMPRAAVVASRTAATPFLSARCSNRGQRRYSFYAPVQALYHQQVGKYQQFQIRSRSHHLCSITLKVWNWGW